MMMILELFMLSTLAALTTSTFVNILPKNTLDLSNIKNNIPAMPKVPLDLSNITIAIPGKLKDVLDLSKLNNTLPAKLKARFGQLAKKGFGNEKIFTGIRNKLQILKEIEKGLKTANGKKVHPFKNTKDIDSLERVRDPDMAQILYDGDVLLTEEQLDDMIQNAADKAGVTQDTLKKLGVGSARTKRQAIRDPNSSPLTNNRWQSPISYSFDSNIATVTKNVIRQALASIANQTCLSFIESSTNKPRMQFRDVVDGECFSFVGFLGSNYYGYFANSSDCTTCTDYGVAPINLGGDHCDDEYGTITHEILHALGIHHHHNRYDRDNYVINGEGTALTNIDSYNYGSPYDYGSVMHYGDMTTTDPLYQKTIRNRRELTFGDMAILNQQYKCTCTSPTVTCLNGGYPNPANCGTCICPGGYGLNTCLNRDKGTENLGGLYSVSQTDECTTMTLSLGTDDGVMNLYHKKAWWHFKAPTGKKVQIIITKQTDSGVGCSDAGVELKVNTAKLNRTGYVFCEGYSSFVTTDYFDVKAFTTDAELAMVELHTRKGKVTVEVRYRYVDSASSSEIPDSCKPTFACIDTDSDCADKAANGECDSDPDNMLKSCTASCNVGQCECRNLNDNCPYWASVGECSNSASYMKTNCKSSCGYCGANTCEDSDPQACEDWAAVGECTADPVYMNQWCAKACQRCGE